MSVDTKPSPEQSLGKLVSTATESVSSLVRLELELAKAEIKASVQQGGTGAGLAAVAAFLAFVAFLMLSVAAALGIGTVLPEWAGFLIVAGVYLLVGGILGYVGVRHFQRVKGPERATAELETTKQYLTERVGHRSPEPPAGG
jgi:hypothetical protein